MQIEMVRDTLLEGHVIPAHPLALTPDRTLDARHQRALTRYYLAAGAGGLAVGVHTTQFEIHDPDVGLYEPVLELAMDEVERAERRPVMIAGLVGTTEQAVAEARTARALGYDGGLLSLAAFPDAPVDALVEHVKTVADVLPVFGFYLQPAVGGRRLPYAFWRRFAEVENVVGIKIAPFDRYETIDVVRAVTDAGRLDDIALYTGNDDTIVVDLLTEFPPEGARIAGGLLGHWAVWTKSAVELLDEIKAVRRAGGPVPRELLTRAAEITDANAAFFDPQHQFAGSIAGIHEVLRRQGLLRGRWTLNPDETLSPGQMDAIDRVYAAYPHLNDDDFVRAHLDEWLA
ncbi:MAG: dihydrodipicolinate synthase family protein [Bacteroidetes bacterium]|jgi:dihydrodipicolinate synthase/N-acetylneuraminate lyase|nr:dihydrodipicolinate synthase family protein [Bacteroidota bacterium]